MSLVVTARGQAAWRGRTLRCAIGRSGIARVKREGDGATPAGAFPVRRVLYRADRMARPATGLAVSPLADIDGWCDDPADPRYNQAVRLPYPARCEALWRDDPLYDLIGVIGFNDEPALSGGGSAIFLHIARPDYAPTEGCVAFSSADLLDVFAEWRPEDRVTAIA
jgi:L,D-peptidoglycan transpeptidase YkuD (ErfK/YbiS/YcfS/YnhG family)